MPRLVPSPALCVATLALVLAGGGAGYAAATIGTADLKTGAVTSDKIADKTIRLQDIAAATQTSLQGATGAPGSARAWGDVSDKPTLVAGRNVSSVIRSTTNIGVYCITLVSGVTASTAVVGIDYNTSEGSNLAAYYSDVPATGCPSTSDFAVRTFAFVAGANNVASNSVGFTFLVP